MGNGQKEAKAEVNVILDTIIYLPGENITGKIKILPRSQNNSKILCNLNVTYSIIQQQNWQNYMFSENDNTFSGDQSDENCVSEKTNNYNELLKNNYFSGIEIPFSYPISNDITPSLEWPFSKFEFAYIRNFFRVHIPDLDYTNQIFIIIQKSPSCLSYPLKLIKEEDSKKYLILKGGKIKVESSYPQYSYPILGKIPLSVSVDASQSETRVKEITVKLKRKIEFKYKNSEKINKNIIQNMYYETKKVNSKKENLEFIINFKDGGDTEYYLSQSMFETNEEICCMLPNVTTKIINLYYYIKIIANIDGILNKNIKLKMLVDFHSKDESKLNNKVYDNFGKTIVKIKEGQIPNIHEEPYINFFDFNSSFNKNQVFLGNPLKQLLNNNKNNSNMNINNNINNNFNMNINNNINNNSNMNINNNINNNSNMNLNINNEMNVQKDLPPPPEDDVDLPSLTEIEQSEKNRYKENNNNDLQYPQF